MNTHLAIAHTVKKQRLWPIFPDLPGLYSAPDGKAELVSQAMTALSL